MSWVEYWDSDHPIYVNARHLDAHYRRLAEDVTRLLPGPGARLLDHGCGEALHAPVLARACSRLVLCDAAPNVRGKLAARTAAVPNIAVLAPDDVAALPDAGFDVIVANSLAQYLTPAELDDLLVLWHRLLAPGGRLILADILPPDLGAATDALALLRFAAAEGFLVPALGGLVRTVFSDYRKLRQALGLTRYSGQDMLEKLRQAGFAPARIPNLGHNPARMAFAAIKPA